MCCFCNYTLRMWPFGSYNHVTFALFRRSLIDAGGKMCSWCPQCGPLARCKEACQNWTMAWVWLQLLWMVLRRPAAPLTHRSLAKLFLDPTLHIRRSRHCSGVCFLIQYYILCWVGCPQNWTLFLDTNEGDMVCVAESTWGSFSWSIEKRTGSRFDTEATGCRDWAA